jgi:hypothetical protein
MDDDDEFRGARERANSLERHRQEEWQSNADYRRELEADIGELYDEAEFDSQMDAWDRTGQSQHDRDLEQYAEGSTSRDIAEAIYDAQGQALQQENDADRLKALKKRDKDLARSHGVRSVEQALEQALTIDHGLRTDPWGTLAALQEKFTSPAATQAQQATWSRHLSAIDGFMRSQGHDGRNPGFDQAIVQRMNGILHSGQFQRSGDFQADLRRLYDSAMQATQRNVYGKGQR